MKLVRAILPLLCTQLIAVFAGDVSPSLARWIYILNGDFSAATETRDASGNPVVEYSNISYVPIEVEGVKDSVVLYTESIAGLHRSLLLRSTEDELGYIQVRVDAVTEADAQESKNHSPAKLPTGAETIYLENCYGLNYEVKDGLYGGTWVDCLQKVNGRHPVYEFQIECNLVIMKIALGTSSLENHFRRQGGRYPEVPSVESKIQQTEDPCKNLI